jgi:GT2 family glycosyltransferase
MMEPHLTRPSISVVVLNYNGQFWVERCLNSIRQQTTFAQIEVIVADNQSSDGSDQLAQHIVREWPNAFFCQLGANLGYCEGNNRAARLARGEYLFFLNNDTRLEPDCLQSLFAEVMKTRADAATPLVLNYDDDTIQRVWVDGFDLFGLPSFASDYAQSRSLFMPPGCSYLIRRDLFFQLGGFDGEIFMYADEYDLSWRVWLSGRKAMAAASARLHHRMGAQVNPEGKERTVEFRTSDTKRYYANRNALLVLAKNCQHVLLLLIPLQLALLIVEAVFSWLITGRWSHVRRSYLGAVRDCWRLRGHILDERKRLRQLRRRSDWQMLRFLRWRFNRWDEVMRLARLGRPKVTPH